MGKGGAAQQEVNEYRMSLHYGIAWEVDGIKKITIGDKVAWEGDLSTVGQININQPELFGGPKKEGGCVGIAYFLPGRETQTLPNALAARFGLTAATCPGFRGISSLFFVGSGESNMQTRTALSFGGIDLVTTTTAADLLGGFYWTANSPFIQGVAATVYRSPKGLSPTTAMIGIDANPIHIIYECMTETDWGMGAPTYHFNTALWESVATMIHTEGFGLSLKWTSQMTIEAFVSEI